MTGEPNLTLRDALLKHHGSSGAMAALSPMYAAVLKSGVLKEFVGFQTGASVALQDVIRARMPAVPMPALQLASARVALNIKLPVLEAFRDLALNEEFSAAQRALVGGFLQHQGVAVAAASLAARTSARIGSPLADDDADHERSYGSHQLSTEATVALAFGLWPMVQIMLASSTDKRLVESYLVTLFLVTLIWCALAAAP